MGSGAASWEVKTTSPERVASAFGQACAQVKKPAGGLIFVSGQLASDIEGVAMALGARGTGVPMVVAVGAGVMTERGEIEDQAAAAGIVWSGGRSEIVEIVPGE